MPVTNTMSFEATDCLPLRRKAGERVGVRWRVFQKSETKIPSTRPLSCAHAQGEAKEMR